MILTVTLNPLLERRLKYSKVIPGTDHRNGKYEISAGGKGINVSRQLNRFGVDNLAFTFIGGSNGKVFNDIVHSENIKIATVRTKNETRGASIIINESNGEVTTFFEPSSDILPFEADEFLARLEKMIPNCEIVVLSGSSPSETTDKIFSSVIEIANKFDKISLCDTYGSHIEACYNAAPTIIHNNINEIQSSLNISLAEEKDKLEFLNSLYAKGIKQAFISDGAASLYCSNFDYHYKVDSPKIKPADPTGSGDAFAAAIVYSWQKDLTFEQSLILAASCGALNASSFETCRVNLNDIESISKDVVISPVGKKMKTVDVTPR